MKTPESQTASQDYAPISDFKDCHSGIFRKLDGLTELAELLPKFQRARQLSEQSVEFFREAIFEHHLDEERELFTAVLAETREGEERARVRQMS